MILAQMCLIFSVVTRMQFVPVKFYSASHGLFGVI